MPETDNNQNPPLVGGEMMDYFHKKMLKETLKYAAGKQLFCAACEQVLDWKTTVLITAKAETGRTVTAIICKKCYNPNGVESLEEQGFTVEVDKWE